VSSCSIPVSSNYFGDPCTGVTKSLVVEAKVHAWNPEDQAVIRVCR
jgi:hypothetical protein